MASYRGPAWLLDQVAGPTRVRVVNDAIVQGLRDELAEMPHHPRTKEPCSTAMISSTLTLLRAATAAWAAVVGVPCPVTRSPKGSARRVGSRRARRTPTAREVHRIAEAARPALRLVLYLIFTTGILPTEALRIRLHDIDLRRRRIKIRGAGVRGRPGAIASRWVYPPRLVWPLLEDTCGAPFVVRGLVHGPGWLFPGRTPGLPLQSVDKGLRGACERAFGRGGRRYTLMDVRRLWQSLAREMGLPRAVVRGTWSEADPARRVGPRRTAGKLKAVRDHLPEWIDRASGRTPRKSPPVEWWEPEIGRRRKDSASKWPECHAAQHPPVHQQTPHLSGPRSAVGHAGQLEGPASTPPLSRSPGRPAARPDRRRSRDDGQLRALASADRRQDTGPVAQTEPNWTTDEVRALLRKARLRGQGEVALAWLTVEFVRHPEVGERLTQFLDGLAASLDDGE